MVYKVKLDKKRILESLNTEEELTEMSTLEAIYDIRKLKLLLEFGNDILFADTINSFGQAYFPEFEIWSYVEIIPDDDLSKDEKWDNRELGCDEDYVKVCNDEALLKLVRMAKEEFKKGLGKTQEEVLASLRKNRLEKQLNDLISKAQDMESDILITKGKLDKLKTGGKP